MAFVNGKWVNEYDRSNWSFGPNGGQGLFNPDRSKVYWSGDTPSFQAPTQSKMDPVTGAVNPGGPGSTAPGWLGPQTPPTQPGQPDGSNSYNPLTIYNLLKNLGGNNSITQPPPANTTNPTDNTTRSIASYFPLNQYYPNQNMPTDPAGGTGRYAPSPFGQQPPGGGGFNYYNYGQ